LELKKFQFTLFAKEIRWHDGHEIMTLSWNFFPFLSYSRGNLPCYLQHAVISKTAELMITKLGLHEF